MSHEVPAGGRGWRRRFRWSSRSLTGPTLGPRVFSSNADTAAAAGGLVCRPTTSTALASKSGPVDSLNVSTRHGCNPARPPDPSDGVLADPVPPGHRTGRPRHGPVVGRRGQRVSDDDPRRLWPRRPWGACPGRGGYGPPTTRPRLRTATAGCAPTSATPPTGGRSPRSLCRLRLTATLPLGGPDDAAPTGTGLSLPTPTAARRSLPMGALS